MIMIAVQAFVAAAATFVLDLVWAEYIRSIRDERAAAAAAHAAWIVVLGAVSTILYVGDHLMIPAAALGGAAGTYYSIRRRRK